MSADIFRTLVSVTPAQKKVTYSTPSIFMGSCFTENIGEKLLWFKLPTIINPFGITYNPFSVKNNIERLIKGDTYTKEDINQNGGLYFSFDHHSRFSDVNCDSCLQKINTSFTQALEALKKSSFIFITFGTSYYYELKSNRQIVSNCHKIPDREFSRNRLTVDEIVKEYSVLIPSLLNFNANLQIIFTVSPIRHWKDGAHENQLSKSVLLLAIDEICKKFGNTGYFPAYEIMMDELRDYRFYEEDMLHPNTTAINYIWKRFYDAYFDKDTSMIMSEVEKIQLSKKHRPFNTQSESFKKFIDQQLFKIDELTKQFPEINLSEELSHFKSFLK